MRTRILLVALTFLVACQGGAPSSQDATVRDSAGVQIVEHAGDPRSAPVRWRTSAEPVLRVGAVEGDEAYLLNVVGDVALLGDGSFVVANLGDQSLRWYDAEGRFLWQRGGPGEGPGEFSHINSLSVTDADSLVVVDASAARFTLFDQAGNLGRTTRLAGLTAPAGRLYSLSSGDWILGAGSGFSSLQLGPNVTAGVHRPLSPLLLVSGDGTRIDSIGMFPGSELQITMVGGGFTMQPAPLGRDFAYTVVDDQIVVGTAERLQFDVYSTGGALIRSVRAPDVDVTLTPEIEAIYRAFMEEQLAQIPEAHRANFRQQVIDTELPDDVPAYSRMWNGADGQVWMGCFRVGRGPQYALVFEVDGDFLGRVELPSEMRVFAVEDGFVWGREMDELGVEYVVKYALKEVQ